MSSNRSSINALSRAEIDNLCDEYPDIRCPCLIPNATGVHQCTKMFKSKFGTSPLRLDLFMKHYVSKAHQGAQVPNEVKKWFPHGCTTPGCKHRYTITGRRLQDHIQQCTPTHNTAQTQHRKTNSEWEQIGNNAATRSQKPKHPPPPHADTTENDDEQVEIQPRQTLNTSPPRCPITN